jgi:YbbR domain-containing protein
MMGRLLHNWPAKVLSVFFALILWFFVTGEQTAEVGFAVPLELNNIPKGMMVVNDLPNLVDVRVSGPRTILSSLRPSDIQLAVDLKGAKTGVTTFRRLEQGINIPPPLKISRISPSTLDVHLETVQEKRVPVKAVLNGEPDREFRVDAVEVVPAEVIVVGASAQLKKIKEISTMPVDIKNLQRDLAVSIPLDFQVRYVSVKNLKDVDVRVSLKKIAEPE